MCIFRRDTYPLFASGDTNIRGSRPPVTVSSASKT